MPSEIDYRRFNAAVVAIIVLIAGIVLVGAVLAGDAGTREKITAVCSIIALVVALLGIYPNLRRLVGRPNSDGHGGESPPDNPST
jgi:hypothetical protein